MRIIVTGLIGQFPFGGAIWDYLQYCTGFRSLGHEVLYLEDSGIWPYDPVRETISEDCRYQVESLSKIMDRFGLSHQWIYRNAADGAFFGAGETVARNWLESAEVLVTVASPSWFEGLAVNVGRRIYIDGDPLFTQVGLLQKPNDSFSQRLRDHDLHFSFGLNLGSEDCGVPDTGINWRPTVQPIDLTYWTPWPAPPSSEWELTTIMNWRSYDSLQWQGQSYGQKDVEFLKFIDLPRQSPLALTVAMGRGKGDRRPTEQLERAGWRLVEPDHHLPDEQSYREFIGQSAGEWSIAKEGYVKARTGWFSGRTACYLASGRPAIVQDTGWSSHLEPGPGLFAFSNLNQCLEAMEELRRNPESHRKAARERAELVFDARAVCRSLLECG